MAISLEFPLKKGGQGVLILIPKKLSIDFAMGYGDGIFCATPCFPVF
jgi:hypothetical protein